MDRQRIKQHAANAKAHAKRIAQDAKYPGTVTGLAVRWVPIGGVVYMLIMFAH